MPGEQKWGPWQPSQNVYIFDTIDELSRSDRMLFSSQGFIETFPHMQQSSSGMGTRRSKQLQILVEIADYGKKVSETAAVLLPRVLQIDD
jgi:hypothetical protein